MANLETNYLGLPLECPVLASSSGITGNIEGIKRCADSGVGAVVLKSMFEEVIDQERNKLDAHLEMSPHPEAQGYIDAELGMQLGAEPYLKLITNAKKAVTVPVIASINCHTVGRWLPFSRRVEAAGADALELNISHFPSRWHDDSETIERKYVQIVQEVAEAISIPVTVKVGFFFTTLWNTLAGLVHAGAKGLVLFNRFYSVDVDLDSRRPVFSMRTSGPDEIGIPIRWVGLAASRLTCDVAASTGIHDAEGVAKVIMMGASVAQVASILYRKGPEHARVLRDGLSAWMDENGFKNLGELRGLALRNADNPDQVLMRLQYVRELERAGRS